MIGTGLKVDTPEGVSFSYELASLADRAKAYLIDLLLRAAGMLLLALIFLLALGPALLAGVGLWLMLYFLVQWGYYVFFEVLWDGQSPGKRMLDLRVVKAAGHPVGFFDSVLRNLLRVADQLPLTYGVGSLAMLMTGRFQRLGDLAAGTVVVREQKAWYGMRDVNTTAPTAEAAAARRVSLSNRERRLLQEFVQRKDRLHPERAEQLARILAQPYAERFGLPMPPRATDLLLQLYQGGVASPAQATPGVPGAPGGGTPGAGWPPGGGYGSGWPGGGSPGTTGAAR